MAYKIWETDCAHSASRPVLNQKKKKKKTLFGSRAWGTVWQQGLKAMTGRRLSSHCKGEGRQCRKISAASSEEPHAKTINHPSTNRYPLSSFGGKTSEELGTRHNHSLAPPHSTKVGLRSYTPQSKRHENFCCLNKTCLADRWLQG